MALAGRPACIGSVPTLLIAFRRTALGETNSRVNGVFSLTSRSIARRTKRIGGFRRGAEAPGPGLCGWDVGVSGTGGGLIRAENFYLILVMDEWETPAPTERHGDGWQSQLRRSWGWFRERAIPKLRLRLPPGRISSTPEPLWQSHRGRWTASPQPARRKATSR